MVNSLTSCPRTRSVLAAIIIAAGAASASGHGFIPGWTPIDRIIENVEARIKENPQDSEAYYVLGRAQGLVYETKNKQVYTWAEQGPYRPFEPAEAGWQKNAWGDKKQDAPTEVELAAALSAAIKNLNEAIRLRPDVAKYRLAMASALEAGVDLAGTIDEHPLCPVAGAAEAAEEWESGNIERLGADPQSETNLKQMIRGQVWDRSPILRDRVVSKLLPLLKDASPERAAAAKRLLIEDWKRQIDEQYYRAMTLALPVEGKATSKPLWGSMEDWVSYEAASHYVARVEARGAAEDEMIFLATAKATKKAFDDLPRPEGITPIVFSLAGGGRLRDLLSPDHHSTFDLDGTNRGLTWEWVRPETGILCWDPAATGAITSGRQLFGSVSWWLFFRHGYEALDALDDNRDGQLRGEELRGLAAWFDRNSNGVSDPGEVVPVGELGIAAISCRATSEDSGCPANPSGIILSTGKRVPTYDWIAHTVAESKHLPRVLPSIVFLTCATIPLTASCIRRRRTTCSGAATLLTSPELSPASSGSSRSHP